MVVGGGGGGGGGCPAKNINDENLSCPVKANSQIGKSGRLFKTHFPISLLHSVPPYPHAL